MERIETSKLNRGLKDILAQVAEGKTFILTRYGKDVARLGPANGFAMNVTPITVGEDGPEEVTIFDTEEGPERAKRIQSARDELLNRVRKPK